jgi:SAM-dependent methyltransferase
MNREDAYRVYHRLEHWIAPRLKYSQYLYEDTLRQILPAQSAWLDLGCGHQILPFWREQEEKSLVQKSGVVVGLDADWGSVVKHRSIEDRVCGDIDALPFRDNSFDLITANMVVEHLHQPDIQFGEIYRVLKPGGVFVFHTPNAHGYATLLARAVPRLLKSKLIRLLDGRKDGDVFRTYYRANTSSRISQIARRTGLEVRKIQFIASSASCAILPPIAFVELLWIRVLLTHAFRRLRTNLIVILAKPLPAAARVNN